MARFFKKGLITAALVLASGSALAGTSTGVFQWTGVAPGANDNDGACIVVAGGVNGNVAHDSGVITFHNPGVDGATHDIQSSTELAFTVVAADGLACNEEVKLPFSYQLTNLKVGVNGSQVVSQALPSAEADGQWHIKHNKPGTAAALLADAEVVAADEGDVVGLSVAGTSLEVASGESVVVQAFVLVTDTTAP